MSVNKPKISVIVPVYNVEKYLEEGVNSICSQTFDNIEIILIDDGSTDESGAICDILARSDQRIKVLHKENGGVSSARNAGVQLAKGEFITFVDPDDILDVRMLEILQKELFAVDGDISVCQLKRFNDGSNPVLDNSSAVPCVLSSTEAIENMLYRRGIVLGPVGKLFKTSLLAGNRFDQSIAIAEDADFNYRVFSNVKSVVLVNSYLYHYRQRAGSAIRSSFSVQKMSGLMVMRSILDNVSNKQPLIIDAARNRLFLEAIYIAMHTHGKDDFKKEYGEALYYIKKLRFGVIKDDRSLTRLRQYAAISILNVGLLMRLLGYVNKTPEHSK